MTVPATLIETRVPQLGHSLRSLPDKYAYAAQQWARARREKLAGDWWGDPVIFTDSGAYPRRAKGDLDTMRYTQPGDSDEHIDGNGNWEGRHTRTVYRHDPLSEPVWAWIDHHTDGRLRGPALITTEERWEGFSEFTVEERWTSIVVSAPQMGYEHRWPTLPEFLKDMAKVMD